MAEGSVWQDGSKETHYPVEVWPISRDFVRAVPEEERRAAIYGVHVAHAVKDVPPNIKLSEAENVVKLYKIVNTVTSRTNNYQKVGGFWQGS